MEQLTMRFRAWDKGDEKGKVKARMSLPFRFGMSWVMWTDGVYNAPLFDLDKTDDECRFIVMRGMGRNDSTGKEIFEGDKLKLTREDGKIIEVICKYGTVERELRNFVGEIHNCEITGFYFLVKERYPTFPIAKNYLGVSDLEIMTITGHIYESEIKL